MVKAFAVDVPGATVEERMASLGRGLAETVRVRWIDKPRTQETVRQGVKRFGRILRHYSM